MNLKTAGAVVLGLALAVPLLAQIDGGPSGPFRGRGEHRALEGGFFGGPRGWERLEDALDLTAAQVASFEPMLEAHREQVRTLAEQLRSARTNVRSLVEAGTDPTAIGNAVLAAHALENQIAAANRQLLDNFRSLLTTDQRERLDSMQAAARERGGPFGRGPGRPRRGPAEPAQP